jgi:hypothetical protein
MSGRIYNAMMKFAGGTKEAPQLADMFFYNGKVYATDSYAICRWTPADKYEILDNTTGEKIEKFYFTPRMNKIPAGTTIYIDDTACDVDYESKMIKDPDNIIESEYKHPIDIVMGVNPDYFAAIAALGKAVKADKCSANGTTDIDWTQKVLHAHINAGCNGYFDIIVMPCVDRTKAKKE